MKLPNKIDLERRLAALRHELGFADAGGRERVGKEIRLVETAQLELQAHEAEAARRRQESDQDLRRDKARQHVQNAARYGADVADKLGELIEALGAYKSETATAVETWPTLKRQVGGTLNASERELHKAIAAELARSGIRLPQNVTWDIPVSETVKGTERALLGAIDGLTAVYAVAADLEASR